MDNFFQNKKGDDREHPSREMLLLCVDGELPQREAVHLETHLEACWPCRVKTKKIQEAIADIVEFDEEVLTPHITPPHNWNNFGRKLSHLAASSDRPSLTSRLFGSLGRYFAAIPLSRTPRLMLTPAGLTAAVVLLIILIVGLAIRSGHEKMVSASDLLKNSIEAQSRQAHPFEAAVIHQKLQVRRRGRASGREESVNWEIWNDTRNSRVRQFAGDAGSEAILPVTAGDASRNDRAEASPAREVVSDLAEVLAANHMNPNAPLSAASYKSWHNTLPGPEDEVTRTNLPDGSDALKLRTLPGGGVHGGAIAEALLVVRARDWQPTELRLDIAAEGEDRIYDLTESISEVLSLSQVDPAIFADQPVASSPPASTPVNVAKREAQPTPADAEPNPQPLTPRPAATAELEVEALALLSQAGADLGEQVSVRRAPDGILHVSGIVDTDQRKAEITNALRPIAASPAVQIEIQTVAEAVASQRSTKKSPSSPVVREVEITGNTFAAEPDVRNYFAGKSKDTDEAVRQYAARIVSLSGQAMDHLWAMKRLLNQLSAEQVRSLTPEARAKWVALIRSHAQAYQQRTAALRRELHPVFFAGQSLATTASEGADIKDTGRLSRAVEQLFELGTLNDSMIRSAFTSTSSGVMTTAIRDPHFWRSLGNAEGLAATIARAQ